MTLILFVCRGNTCRSPLAEALARKLCRSLDFQFASAGMAPSPPGGPASAGALTAAAAHGLDLSHHTARLADAALLATATHILALDRSVRDDLLARTPTALHPRISLLLSYAPHLGRDDVADPWGGDGAAYERAHRDIEAGVTGLLASLAQPSADAPPPASDVPNVSAKMSG
jgi:protein-tyrosine phosphatase